MGGAVSSKLPNSFIDLRRSDQYFADRKPAAMRGITTPQTQRVKIKYNTSMNWPSACWLWRHWWCNGKHRRRRLGQCWSCTWSLKRPSSTCSRGHWRPWPTAAHNGLQGRKVTQRRGWARTTLFNKPVFKYREISIIHIRYHTRLYGKPGCRAPPLINLSCVKSTDVEE